MGYIQDFERELTTLLENGDEQALIKFVKEKVLESYWNGTKATKTVDGNPNRVGTTHKATGFRPGGQVSRRT